MEHLSGWSFETHERVMRDMDGTGPEKFGLYGGKRVRKGLE